MCIRDPTPDTTRHMIIDRASILKPICVLKSPDTIQSKTVFSKTCFRRKLQELASWLPTPRRMPDRKAGNQRSVVFGNESGQAVYDNPIAGNAGISQIRSAI